MRKNRLKKRMSSPVFVICRIDHGSFTMSSTLPCPFPCFIRNRIISFAVEKLCTCPARQWRQILSVYTGTSMLNVSAVTPTSQWACISYSSLFVDFTSLMAFRKKPWILWWQTESGNQSLCDTMQKGGLEFRICSRLNFAHFETLQRSVKSQDTSPGEKGGREVAVKT